MKKLLVISAVVAAAAGANAQGLISFNNTSSAVSKISVNTTPGSAVSGLTGGAAGSYYYALFYSTTTAVDAGAGLVSTATTVPAYVTSNNSFSFSGAYAQSSATAGRVTGSASQAVNGVGLAGSANFVIIGWSANIGSTVASLAAYLAAPSLISGNYGYVGESSVVNLTLGDGGSVPTPNALSGSAIPGFVLGAVAPAPEPTTIALAGLGGLSLLAFRRKNA
jgi:hypothetical protein